MNDPLGLPIAHLLADWCRAVLGHEGSIEDARAAAERHRHRVDALNDPFMPLALGDHAARAKERILWENEHAMVLVDIFSRNPKALVVPKAPMLFPTDTTPEHIHELAKIAHHTAAAFLHASGTTGPIRCWINPPNALMVRQLHVHVLPNLSWADVRARGAHGDVKDSFYKAVSAALRQRT